MRLFDFLQLLLVISLVYSRHTKRRHRPKPKDADAILSKKNSIDAFPGKVEEQHELKSQLEELNSIDADEHLRDLSKIEMENQEEKLAEKIEAEGERTDKMNKLDDKEKEKGEGDNHLLSLSKAIEKIKI